MVVSLGPGAAKVSAMRLSDTHIKWIMLVSGALTCTMAYAFIAPQAALMSTFGAALEGPVANVVVRNWP